MSEDYFRLTSQLLHKYDPNHLNLGVRYRGYAPREVVAASRGYTDAQSLNYYVSDARLDEPMFKMMNEQSGQPVVISEYSFHSLDGRSGDRNSAGFASQVLDQQARAEGYKLFTTRLARVPFVVGADWFQWSDEPPSGRSSDGEDVNFGVVDVDDVPYESLAKTIAAVAPTLDGVHRAASISSAEVNNVFRESFDNKPTFHVPFLQTPPTLNGELSDWPATAKLMGMRHSQTVGLERSTIPLPNVYLGWTQAGLYVGLEVFDGDIEGSSPTGWFWTRDHAEFWLSTQPTVASQDAYDLNDHDFFFIPTPPQGTDGVVGTVGQFHRAGDALTETIVPQPTIQKVARVLPGKYVVEMFIPAAAMHDWNPTRQPNLAFNIHVKNYQHAIDYFWSAPKEVMTQSRPGTWGAIVLDAPPQPANDK